MKKYKLTLPILLFALIVSGFAVHTVFAVPVSSRCNVYLGSTLITSFNFTFDEHQDFYVGDPVALGGNYVLSSVNITGNEVHDNGTLISNGYLYLLFKDTWDASSFVVNVYVTAAPAPTSTPVPTATPTLAPNHGYINVYIWDNAENTWSYWDHIAYNDRKLTYNVDFLGLQNPTFSSNNYLLSASYNSDREILTVSLSSIPTGYPTLNLYIAQSTDIVDPSPSPTLRPPTSTPVPTSTPSPTPAPSSGRIIIYYFSPTLGFYATIGDPISYSAANMSGSFFYGRSFTDPSTSSDFLSVSLRDVSNGSYIDWSLSDIPAGYPDLYIWVTKAGSSSPSSTPTPTSTPVPTTPTPTPAYQQTLKIYLNLPDTSILLREIPWQGSPVSNVLDVGNSNFAVYSVEHTGQVTAYLSGVDTATRLNYAYYGGNAVINVLARYTHPGGSPTPVPPQATPSEIPLPELDDGSSWGDASNDSFDTIIDHFDNLNAGHYLLSFSQLFSFVWFNFDHRFIFLPLVFALLLWLITNIGGRK